MCSYQINSSATAGGRTTARRTAPTPDATRLLPRERHPLPTSVLYDLLIIKSETLSLQYYDKNEPAFDCHFFYYIIGLALTITTISHGVKWHCGPR